MNSEICEICEIKLTINYGNPAVLLCRECGDTEAGHKLLKSRKYRPSTGDANNEISISLLFALFFPIIGIIIAISGFSSEWGYGELLILSSILGVSFLLGLIFAVSSSSAGPKWKFLKQVLIVIYSLVFLCILAFVFKVVPFLWG